MSEPVHHSREIPPRRGVKIADLTLMVRVPGRPAAIRVFTDGEKSEAARYAEKEGGQCVPLPVPDPAWDWSTR
ncbi:hypothetical protein [Mycobacteroides abscessus]|uniref:hypothetical protein n=1 Tax=Mycobacteroides abscessus TaxID=36809 RepID=UPI0009A6023A|nr:hypothetical protein [Mycobacteroides abscessus]